MGNTNVTSRNKLKAGLFDHYDILGGVAVTANTAGDGTAIIADGTKVVEATGVTGQVNYIITLPTPTPGTKVLLMASPYAYELRSSAPSTVLLNGATGGAAVEIAVAAAIMGECICETALNWIVTLYSQPASD